MSCRRCLSLVLLGFCALLKDDASNALWAQGAYPRVMSPTGRFYGPTQAHYQYQRQYGQPWWGGPAPVDPNVGVNINIPAPTFFGPGFGYGGYYIGTAPFSAYGYSQQRSGFPLPGYGLPLFNGYTYNGAYQNQMNFGGLQQQFYAGSQPAPYAAPFGPQFQFSWQQQYQQQFPNGQFPRDPLPPPPGDPQFGRAPQPGFVGAPVPRGGVVNVRPLGPEEPIISRPHQLLPQQPSSLEQQARSIHFQGQGDIWFRKQNYLQAYSRYKQAAGAASDQAAPHFRMAYALIALKRYDLAVSEMARGIQLDPKYPLTGDSPAKVFGPENQIAAGALAGQVADWVKQEIRSPDRLFLLGALLRMNGDLERSKICFEAAAQQGGRPAPVMAFLKVDQQPVELAKTGRPRIPADDRPPVPEAVEELLKNNQNWVPRNPSEPVGTGKPVNPSPKPNDLPVAGPQLPAVPTAPETDVPALDSETDEEIPPVPTPKKKVDPTSGAIPAENLKPKTAVPGFQPIPKKGSINQSSGQQGPDVSGPVIPIPQTEN